MHVDREVGLVHHHIEPFCLLELACLLQPVRLRDVEPHHVRVRHVLSRHAVCLLPLVCLRVHLDGVLRRTAAQIEALRLVIVARGLIVLCDLQQVRLSFVSLQSLDDLGGFGPLAARDRRLDGLDVGAGLGVMVDRGVGVLGRHEVVSPQLLELDDVAPLEAAARELDGAPVGLALAIAIHRLPRIVETLEELPSLVVHPRGEESTSDRLEERGLEVFARLVA
mmetsp:Transcript_21230/g.42962  ORF Transcript_21230/g.42962 Transcript_21230/m.42962 type:complete len:223 (-) Transcript_21230:1637-2305(-)